MEIFGRYAAFVLLVGFVFLIPIAYQQEKLNRIQRLYIIENGEQFVKKASTEKIISVTEWEKFYEKMNRCGKLCVAELTIATVKENVNEMAQLGEHYQMIYDYEIKKELYETGYYRLESGQFLTVKVYEKKDGVKRVYFERAGKIR